MRLCFLLDPGPASSPHVSRMKRRALSQETAYDVGAKYVEHTGRAVDYGFLLTVEKAKQAVEYTGVADMAAAAVEVTNQAIISSARRPPRAVGPWYGLASTAAGLTCPPRAGRRRVHAQGGGGYGARGPVHGDQARRGWGSGRGAQNAGGYRAGV